MGERSYALEMVNLLDPGMVYFNSKVFAEGDCTTKHLKGLDVVLGQENVALILDDIESIRSLSVCIHTFISVIILHVVTLFFFNVWSKHRDNLISMERYHFFASSCRQFGYQARPLYELRSDESDVDGALTTVLKVLKRVLSMFYDLERLGATCLIEVDPSVTQAISTDAGTEKSRWVVMKKKFLVEPRWLEVANFLWQKQDVTAQLDSCIFLTNSVADNFYEHVLAG